MSGDNLAKVIMNTELRGIISLAFTLIRVAWRKDRSAEFVGKGSRLKRKKNQPTRVELRNSFSISIVTLSTTEQEESARQGHSVSCRKPTENSILRESRIQSEAY
jgi:hypothetical protein